MCAAERRYTADDLADMPDDGNRYEVIDGVLYVTPAPVLSHQWVQARLIAVLPAYVQAIGLMLFVAPTAVRASEITEVQPDLLIFDPARVDPDEERRLPMSSLVLAVEILSPSTRHRDRGLKRRTYLANGVAEYWVVDAKRRSVDVWQAGAETPDVRVDTLTWQPVVGHAPLVINLGEIFTRVFDRR
ncbi:MAG: Uma2 family endonuclease [Gemmatimonadaceae bacterium]|nr:Uma2 family endonuclease [Gemmatimonadaceae bacterium]